MSGLGNVKEEYHEKFGLRYGQGATFVCIDTDKYHIKPMFITEHKGVDDNRRDHERQLQTAIELDELEYYTFMDEFEFRQVMKDWAGMNHNEEQAKKIKATKARATNIYAQTLGKVEQVVRANPKVGRNDPCPCNSGKKYKKCCDGKWD